MESTPNNTNTGILLFRTLHGNEVTLGTFILSLFRITLAMVILILNSTVINVMIKNYQYRTIHDRLIIGLSASSAGTGVCLLGHVSQNIFFYQIVNECLFRFGLTMAFLLNCGLQLLSLTIERFFRIFRPFGVKSVSPSSIKRFRRFLVPSIWIFSFTMSMLPFTGWKNDNVVADPDGRICSYFRLYKREYLGLMVLIVAISIVMSLSFYIAIYRVARHHFVSISALAQKSNTYRTALRFAKTVFVLIGLYVICWMPYFILVVFEITGNLDNVSYKDKDKYVIYTVSLIYITSISSPIIYSVGNQKVCHRVKRVFCVCCSFGTGGDLNEDNTDEQRTRKPTRSNVGFTSPAHSQTFVVEQSNNEITLFSDLTSADKELQPSETLDVDISELSSIDQEFNMEESLESIDSIRDFKDQKQPNVTNRNFAQEVSQTVREYFLTVDNRGNTGAESEDESYRQ